MQIGGCGWWLCCHLQEKGQKTGLGAPVMLCSMTELCSWIIVIEAYSLQCMSMVVFQETQYFN